MEMRTEQEVRQRAVVRRVLLGTVTIIAFMWALWDGWDVPVSVFIDALLGIAAMIIAAIAFGAVLGGLLAWLRRRGERSE